MSLKSTGPSDWQGTPLVVKPKTAWMMLACSNTRGYELLNAGELESFLDGRSRKITVDSIHRYIARKLGATGSGEATESLFRRRGRPRKVHTAEGASLT
jgi:hypothetical protein